MTEIFAIVKISLYLCIMNENNFTVFTYAEIKTASNYCHWSDELVMIICKDGVELRLESKEIEQVVKALPKTIGGKY